LILLGVPPLPLGGYNYITPRRADLSATAGLSCYTVAVLWLVQSCIRQHTQIDSNITWSCRRHECVPDTRMEPMRASMQYWNGFNCSRLNIIRCATSPTQLHRQLLLKHINFRRVAKRVNLDARDRIKLMMFHYLLTSQRCITGRRSVEGPTDLVILVPFTCRTKPQTRSIL